MMLKYYRIYRNLKLSPTRHFSTSIKVLNDCNSCGVHLQKENPNLSGFYIEPKVHEVGKFESLQDVKYLLFSQELQQVKEDQPNMADESDMNELWKKAKICKRCSEAVNQNKYDVKNFSRCSYEDITKQLPANSTVANIAPLSEFPFHLNLQRLKEQQDSNILILTKADQVLQNKSSVANKLPVVFKDLLKNHYDIDTNRIAAVSASKQWNVKAAYTLLKDYTYLVGNANVGKSTLINSLIEEYTGYKMKLNKKGELQERDLDQQSISNSKRFIKLQLAGVSHLPNLTQNLQPYKIKNKIIYDLPGYTANIKDVYLEDIIEASWLERIRKTQLFKTKKLKEKKYTSIIGTKHGACYTVGGIFFLVPPENTINQIVKYIPGESFKFNSVDKGLDIFANCYQSDHPLKKYNGLTKSFCSKTMFVRHVLPPFHGSVEVVLKDIGYFLLRTTGAYSFKGLHEIWVPKGIEVCIREPLEKLIETKFEEIVNSNNVPTKDKKIIPLVSSTYIMNQNDKNPVMKMRRMFRDLTVNDRNNRERLIDDPLYYLARLNEKKTNMYWYYKMT